MIKLIVEMVYGDGECGHLVYEVPKEKLDEVKKAIGEAYDDWFADSETEDCIDEYISRRLAKVGVFDPAEYDVISLDMSVY